MRSLFQKSFLSIGLVTASLALGGNAMAATAHVKAPRASRPAMAVAAAPGYPDFSAAGGAAPRTHLGYGPAASAPYPLGFAPYRSAAGMRVNVAQLIGLLVGGSWPVHYGGKIGSSGSSGYDPTFDTPSPSAPIDTSAQDAANAASAAAAAQEANDIAAMTASNAAAAEQNAEASAAATQYMINNQ